MHDTESETKRIRYMYIRAATYPHGRRRVEQLALMNRLLLLLGLLGVAAGLRDCLELRLKLLLALLACSFARAMPIIRAAKSSPDAIDAAAREEAKV